MAIRHVSVKVTAQLINREAVKQMLIKIPHRFNDVMSACLNDGVKEIRTTGKKLVPQVWGVDNSEMKDFKTKNSTKAKLEAEATLTGKNIALHKLKRVTPKAVMPGQMFYTQGRKAFVGKGQGTTHTTYQKNKLIHTFVADLGKRGRGIYELVLKDKSLAGTPGMAKYKTYKKMVDGRMQDEAMVRKLSTTSVAGMILSKKTPEIQVGIENALQKSFEKNFVEESRKMLAMEGWR